MTSKKLNVTCITQVHLVNSDYMLEISALSLLTAVTVYKCFSTRSHLRFLFLFLVNYILDRKWQAQLINMSQCSIPKITF